MPGTKPELLIVDDEPSIRMSLSLVLAEIGYSVRTAVDGLFALAELRSATPDVLLSDLNMPGLSGGELLTIVRRQFPAIRTIAMSGAFSGFEVPTGVAADGFYQKGASVACLLKIMAALPLPGRAAEFEATEPEIIWVRLSGAESPDKARVEIACPACQRSIPLTWGDDNSHVNTGHCAHCHTRIRYALVEPDLEPDNQVQGKSRDNSVAMRQPSSVPPYFY